MDNNNAVPGKLLVLIALIQGFCLLLLHQATDLRYWPQGQAEWLLVCYAIVLIWPTQLVLGLTSHSTWKFVSLTALYSLLAGILSYYTGIQAAPGQSLSSSNLLTGFVVSFAIASFTALVYIQQISTESRLNYRGLFQLSWRNFLSLSLALLLAGCVWLILMLWAAMFSAIGIEFFNQLFSERWFIYPALSLAYGLGIVISRSFTSIMDTLIHLLQALMKFLLVILAFLALLFLFALLFTGLQPLWKSGGSMLILWMQALILFFLNAVYSGEDGNRPYPPSLHRIVSLAVAVLPIYSAISCYGLSLRVQQYGWTVDRGWAYLIWLFLALFPLGYWWGFLRHRFAWTRYLGQVNIGAGLAVILVLLMANSPLLDLRKLAAKDQLQRLEDGDVSIEEFDIHYLRYRLAKPGYEGLDEIKQNYAATHPEIAAEIDALYRVPAAGKKIDREMFDTSLSILSGNPPQALLDTLYRYAQQSLSYNEPILRYFLKPLDMNSDGEMEYLFVEQRSTYLAISIYQFRGYVWKAFSVASLSMKEGNARQVIAALKADDVRAVPPVTRDIVIGERRFEVHLPPQDRP